MKGIAMLLLCTTLMLACGEHAQTRTPQAQRPSDTLKTQAVTYDAGGVSCRSVAVFDPSWKEAHPVVLVLPEWWGLSDYPVSRARQLAAQGYFALAVDFYGQGQKTEDPEQAGKLAQPFYQDTARVKERLQAAWQALENFPQADRKRVALVGYCFGGSMGLMASHMHLPLRGVVSIHGGLKGTAGPTQVPLLVCQGGADQFVGPAVVAAWRKTMDSLGVAYTFKTYPGATHAFSNPEATELGKRLGMPIAYNAAADTASEKEMLAFLREHLR